MVDQGKIFVDRREAGVELGKLLEPEYGGKNALVIGIPRGGVEVAYEVAKILQAELSVIVTKKLPHPDQPELAIGAAAEDGSVYLTSRGKMMHESVIRQIVQIQLREIQSRVQRFRHGSPIPVMENRIVIIVDDGIATGATIIPAIKLCRQKNPAAVVVAAPVSGQNFIGEMASLVDDIKIVTQPDDFYAVGQVYEDFHGLSDEEVTGLLDDFTDQRSNYV